MDYQALLEQDILGWLATSGLRILVIVLVMFALAKVLLFALRRVFDRIEHKSDTEYTRRVQTLRSITRVSVQVATILLGAVAIMGEMGIAIGPLLTAAGVLGVAVGFGSQYLVQDVINGFFLLYDDQIRVGDVVRLGDKAGVVEKMSFRLTVLRDLDGNVHFVRNSQIPVVTNMTKGFSRYVFDVGVAYREDVDEVMEVLRQVDAELRTDEEFNLDILEPLEILGLDKFDASSIVIKARTTTRPLRQWAVGREFNRRLKKRFDELGIEIPFPHLTLYAGQGKDGSAPPLPVRMWREGGDPEPGSGPDREPEG